ncbi:MAG: DUF1707 domain-containing protein [Brooklawnia sp.]|uniref:DUF1707 SHOCT-like domain-containing protein n=1 Tax=Brooklawnia sp. TaxID=2699740 RepID=UPI003C780B5C
MTENPEQWQQGSRLRAGDADRQRAIETLTSAWRAGRITRDEFQERNQQLFTATYTDELEALTADIGGLSGAPGPAAYPGGALVPNSGGKAVQDSWQSDPDANLPARRYATDDSDASTLSVGVMSGMEKVGRWTVAPTHVSIGFWGGTTLDLRDAVFVSPETTITCIAVMGGIEVIVPPEMDVRITGVGVMGGFGWEKIDQARPARQPHPDGPVVRINGVGFWGGVEVYRRERGEPLR